MAKYISYTNPAQAQLIAAHMANMGFQPEILSGCGQVRTFVSDGSTEIFSRLLDKLEKIM